MSWRLVPSCGGGLRPLPGTGGGGGTACSHAGDDMERTWDSPSQSCRATWALPRGEQVAAVRQATTVVGAEECARLMIGQV